MKLANPVRTLRLRSVLAFVYNWWLEVVIATMLLCLCFGPSLDVQQEAHGYIVSDGYVTGNGVLIRDSVNGKDRIRFLTCRHVVTAVMLTNYRAFIDLPTPENAIYIREPGTAFRYIKFSNIEPLRWKTIDDERYDFAWIELTDDEINTLSSSGRKLSAIDLDEDVALLRHASHRVFKEGHEVEVTSLFAPVYGSGPAHTKSYYWPRIPLVFINRTISLSHNRKAKVLIVNKDVKVEKVGREGVGEVMRPQMILDLPIHVNISGSPVFSYFEEDGQRVRKLVGLMDVGIGEGHSGFQTLDAVIPLLRDEQPEMVVPLSLYREVKNDGAE